MSSGPLLYLRLDELANGAARDSSGNALDAATRGGPRIVGDDTFGSVLELDGADDGLDLPAGAVPAGAELSVCVWLNGAGALPKESSILWAADESGAATVDVRVAGGDPSVRFDHGNSGGGTDRLEQPASASDYAGAWTHWAFVRAAEGTMDLYRNGVRWGGGSAGNARARAAAATVRAGWNAGGSWAGRMAHLRVYDRGVSAEEIARMMEDDRTAQSSFRRSYPFDLYLHDGEDQEVLYITDAAEGKPLHVEISNQSGLSVALLKPEDPTAGPRNHHFALRFRPGTLSGTSLAAAQEKLDAALQPAGWRGNAASEADGTAALYFLRPDGGEIAAGQTLGFVFPHASADAGGGARGTRVEMRFAQLAFGGAQTPVTGRRVTHLNVVNHQGEREIPLHAGFVGNDVVLNDGSANALTLRISNTRKDGAIAFTGAQGDAPSRLIVLFDTQAAGETRDWAVGEADQVAGATVTARAVHGGTEEPWTPDPIVEAQTPEWVFTPPGDTQLAPGEWIEVEVSGLVTGLPGGPATMYVRYQNVPGYWDGQLTAALEKGRIVQRGDHVGIGTAAPQDALHLTGNLRVDGGQIRSSSRISLNPDVDGTGDGFVQVMRPDGGESLRVTADGKVGIGTSAPRDALHVTGNLRVDGGQIRSTSCLSLKPDTDGTGDGFVQVMRPDGSESLRVAEDGKVGIGTTSPVEKLHVAGNVRADGGQFQSGGPVQLRPDLYRTGDGNVSVLSNVGVEVLRISTEGAVGGLGGTIRKGIPFSAGTGAVKVITSGGWNISLGDADGIRIEASTRGVLGTRNADVLTWLDGAVVIKGDLYAYQKHFRVPHPLLPGRDLVHGCLEGPENAVYYRGTARLTGGAATVHLPDYFEALTVKEGRTVQLTARGRVPFALSHGGVAEGRFEVFGSVGEGEFDWEVRAARADRAPLETDLPAV